MFFCSKHVHVFCVPGNENRSMQHGYGIWVGSTSHKINVLTHKINVGAHKINVTSHIFNVCAHKINVETCIGSRLFHRQKRADLTQDLKDV